MVNVSEISESEHTNAHIREVSVCVGNGLHGQLCVIKLIITPPVSKHLSGPRVQTPDAHVCTNQLRMHMRTHTRYHFCSMSINILENITEHVSVLSNIISIKKMSFVIFLFSACTDSDTKTFRVKLLL